jgi:hypothetical protein
MLPFTPPKAVAVEVVAAQTTEADRAAIAHLRARDNKPLPDAVYLVKVRFETIPPATSHGWALYVNGQRIPKYWAYKDGVYFKVFDPQFFVDHQGQPLRFSLNGTEFVDTGLKLGPPEPSVQAAVGGVSGLPPQAEALK